MTAPVAGALDPEVLRARALATRLMPAGQVPRWLGKVPVVANAAGWDPAWPAAAVCDLGPPSRWIGRGRLRANIPRLRHGLWLVVHDGRQWWIGALPA